MRYEVYGIYSVESGTNYKVGVAKSMAKAMKLVRSSLNRLTCVAFAVLEKQNRHSYPYSITAGMTDN